MCFNAMQTHALEFRSNMHLLFIHFGLFKKSNWCTFCHNKNLNIFFWFSFWTLFHWGLSIFDWHEKCHQCLAGSLHGVVNTLTDFLYTVMTTVRLCMTVVLLVELNLLILLLVTDHISRSQLHQNSCINIFGRTPVLHCTTCTASTRHRELWNSLFCQKQTSTRHRELWKSLFCQKQTWEDISPSISF